MAWAELQASQRRHFGLVASFVEERERDCYQTMKAQAVLVEQAIAGPEQLAI